MAAGRIEYACRNVIADTEVPLKNHGYFFVFYVFFVFYLIDEQRNVLKAEFGTTEKYTRHCRTRAYFQWIFLRGKCM